MALYRFEAKIISRSGGRSAVHAAAYRSGKTATSAAAYRHAAVLTDERTGQTYDYSRKRGVEGSLILVPDAAPGWAAQREHLWNEVERVEKRKDSQLARDFVISLPHELDDAERRAALTDFLTRNFLDRGYLCDVAYHAPHGDGDDRNYHAHVMVPMRRLDGDGFAAKKDRPDGPPQAAWQAELARWRKDWADTVNTHLEAAGRPERVSHLSLVDQGIDREPEPKQGPIATVIERAGEASYAGDDRRATQERNAQRARIAAEPAPQPTGLEQESSRRMAEAPSSPADEEQRDELPGTSSVTTSKGGMVAQQAEALRRFRDNSAALEARRRDRPERGAGPPPATLENTDTSSSVRDAAADRLAVYEERAQRILERQHEAESRNSDKGLAR